MMVKQKRSRDKGRREEKIREREREREKGLWTSRTEGYEKADQYFK